EIIRWAKRLGKRRYILGGGYRAGDGIFRYKRSFAPHGITAFYIGHCIFNHTIYQMLVDQRMQQAGLAGLTWPTSTEYFPLYRS
ncbi:MAG: GNAT family N-acetyltransferase, partial [Planctomycetota bacterium]